MSILPLLFVQTATSRNNYPINRDLSLRFMGMDYFHCNVAKELTHYNKSRSKQYTVTDFTTVISLNPELVHSLVFK